MERALDRQLEGILRATVRTRQQVAASGPNACSRMGDDWEGRAPSAPRPADAAGLFAEVRRQEPGRPPEERRASGECSLLRRSGPPPLTVSRPIASWSLGRTGQGRRLREGWRIVESSGAYTRPMRQILLIDDLRTIDVPDAEVVVARTAAEGMVRIEERPWDSVLLDHDLGPGGDVRGSSGCSRSGRSTGTRSLSSA